MPPYGGDGLANDPPPQVVSLLIKRGGCLSVDAICGGGIDIRRASSRNLLSVEGPEASYFGKIFDQRKVRAGGRVYGAAARIPGIEGRVPRCLGSSGVASSWT